MPHIIQLGPLLRRCAQMLSVLRRTLRLVYAGAPRWTIAWFALLLAQAFLPVASVYITRLLVNSIILAMNSRGSLEAIENALIMATLLGGVLIATELVRSLSDWIRSGQAEVIQDYIKNIIHTQAATVDYALYESSEYHDRLYRAANEGSGGVVAMIENIGGMLQSGITLLGMAAMLIPYGGWVPVMLIASTLPALYVAFHFNRRYHKWWAGSTPDRRWAMYYDGLQTGYPAAAELRLFNLGASFRSAYQSLRRDLRSERLALTRDRSMAGLGASFVSLLLSAVVIFISLGRVLQGLGSLGDLTLFYQAFASGQGLIRSVFSNLGQMYSNTLFLGNLFEFLDLKNQVTNPVNASAAPSQLVKGIQLHDVTFRYQPDRPPAVSNLDLDIPAGQVVAVVGPNGSGKSTLLKLLCRFYDPESGTIELDGIDIRKLPLDQLRHLISVLFQSPIWYAATAADNIRFGDLASSPSRAHVEQAARSAGAHEAIVRLPKGYDTLLVKLFAEGVELSGGEWQRVALARAYLRQAQIVILDEPTSFMDSWAEAEWFQHLRELVKGKTTIIITHRFTIAMRADIIHVMNKGQIVESGTHSELVARGGFYAQSWASQMQASRLDADDNSISVPLESTFLSSQPSQFSDPL